MTALSERKTRLVLETSDAVFERGETRSVILEPGPYTVSVRLKGMRTRFEISYGAIYNLAVKKEVERVRIEKKAKKGGRR